MKAFHSLKSFVFANSAQMNIRVYSVSDWELVTGHMSYVSQSECQKVLGGQMNISNVAPSFGRFYIFFT